MGAMLRSDPMSLCNMYLQPEAAFQILSHIGDLGCVQFIDMTPDLSAFQKHYTSEVCRCAEIERKLRYLETEMTKDGVCIPDYKDEPDPMYPNEINTYENMLEKLEEDILEMSAYLTKLVKNQEELSQMFYVLNEVGPILGDVELRRDSLFVSKGIDEPIVGGRLHVTTGVVLRSKCHHFEMMLWRLSRGNIHFRTAAEDKLFEQPATGVFQRKVAFLAVCQGEKLSKHLVKICSGFRVHVYPCPKTYDERREMLSKLEMRISDLNQVLNKSKYHRCKALRNISKQFATWRAQVKKAKAIYHVMNLFNLDITNKCLIGQCWVPDRDLTKIQKVLEDCSGEVGSNVPSFMSKTESLEIPPTFHRTNKFTNGFQALISAYGDSTYGELNPGLYTIITFPFLFAVMFGDVCHGLIVVAFGGWMVIKEKAFLAQRSTNEIWNIMFGGRYIILLMGMFTLYTGFIYNDWFSKPIVLMDSYWINTFKISELSSHEILSLDPAGETKKQYILGVDPIWGFSKNKIMFDNSLKMKMSIILGVIHMMFGLWISLFNHIHFKRYHAIILEFLPEVLFLTCLFVWLGFLIFFKWFTYSAKKDDIKLRPGCAPLILILFIDMTLMRTTKAEDPNCDAYMFNNEALLQTVLLMIGVSCVPVLLLGSPLYILKTSKKKRKKAEKKLRAYKTSEEKKVGFDRKEELLIETVAKYSHSFGELMIHQGVHTIEFVLSTISHTASYLRLWALSLAHAQLSEMLWGMVLSKLALHDHSKLGCIKIFVVFAIWAVFSLSILVVMEGLSAFLHTLRLHWVEFMSKFYTGGGVIFRPFSFKEVLYGEGKEDTGSDGACNKLH